MLLLPLFSALAALPTEEELFRAVVVRIDRDGNGSVSRGEYVRLDTTETFSRIDADQDGVATAGELADWARSQQPRPAERTRPDTPGFAPLTRQIPPPPKGCAHAPIHPIAPLAVLLLVRRRR